MAGLTDKLDAHHAALTSLCNALESIADDLPNFADPPRCLYIANTIHPIVRSAHEFEESTVFGVLLNTVGTKSGVSASLERLRYEHWEDQGYALEINEGLLAALSDRRTGSADHLGYMLRGFFGGMRRHIAFEVEYIRPILVSLQHERQAAFH